jgi:hypothetical protein
VEDEIRIEESVEGGEKRKSRVEKWFREREGRKKDRDKGRYESRGQIRMRRGKERQERRRERRDKDKGRA